VTRDVSGSGVCFEADSDQWPIDTEVEICLHVPAAEGISPFPGNVSCRGRVIRVTRLANGAPGQPAKYGITARFLDKLRLNF
jgi:hypothetical protein